MGLTREQLKQRAEKRLTEYLKVHGKKIDESLIIWDKRPIVVKDICVLSAVIENGVVIFCDYDVKNRTYDKSFSRTFENLEHHHIDRIINSLTEYDTYQDRKSKQK